MASIAHNDLTVVYYTANHVKESFGKGVRHVLQSAIGNTPLISVSKQPMDFGRNICVGPTPRTTLNIYRQALVGVKAATTPYVALAEDDVLYSPEHFTHRPKRDHFAYNIGNWGIYTWKPDIFSYKGRRALLSLICERSLFIEAMEERFAKWPNDDDVDLSVWSEPGKYERSLGVTVRKSEEFYTNPANVVFSHEEALAFDHLGTRKRVGKIQAIEIPYWGKASEVSALYV